MLSALTVLMLSGCTKEQNENAVSDKTIKTVDYEAETARL